MSEKIIGITVKKKENFSEWFTQVVTKAGLADQRYNVQGFIVHMPWAMRIIREIYRLFEQELERTGHEPVLFPLVIPEENFEKEKEHVEGFKPEVFWVTEAGNDKLERRLALRPTSETAFYQMYALWITSWRDLPLKLYQSVSVYRYEKTTRPFIRGREFLWIEAHDAFATHRQALRQVREDMENSRKVIWEQLGIPFLFLKRPPWDKFKGAEDTYAADTLMPDGRVLQISSTHDLGQRFAKAFGITFMDKNGKEKYVWQTCYGPGVWRILAALVAIHGDDKGLVLPFRVAPVQVVIIPIYYDEEEKKLVMRKCRRFYLKLKRRNIRVLVDTRDKTPGWKFNDWELKGVPIRLEIGRREVEQGFVTIFRRDLKKREKVPDDEVVDRIYELAEEILDNLKNRAKKFFEENIVSANSKKGLVKAIKEGKIVKISFCGKEECAEDMREATNGAKVRGTSLDFKEGDYGKCVWCGQPARYLVYVAKAY
ncbi:MAG: proline--tRNA ligase [Thermoprotei archaeon]|nr:MAG: proline--tRNA ligase [Thermoprotei archaeon]